MAEQIDIDISINMNNVDEVDDLTSRLSEATAEVESLQEALSETELSGDDIEADVIADELSEATAEAESLQEQLDSVGNTTGLDNVNEQLEETESRTSSLGTALGGLAGTLAVDTMITKADNINTSWNQLELTFGNTSVSMDSLKGHVSDLQASTGRSGTQIRDYFNQMGIAGITNTDLLATSFNNMAGRAYQTGSSIESMEGAVQKMVMSGNSGAKMLANLGITSSMLADAMGVTEDQVAETFKSLSESERLEAINKAMGDGTQANEMYKDSYAGLKQQADMAMGGLMSSIGQGILPVVNPIIESATGLVKGFTDAFKSLPGPVRGAVGGIAGFLAIGTTLIGTLGLVGQVGHGVVDGLRSMKSGYDTVKGAMGTAKRAMDALRASESLTEGVRAALAIATGAEATAEAGGAAAKTAATGPTTALAIAENSLLWPLLLIVGAVIAVIAVMWYLYNTNETVRNGINWLISKIQEFIAGLMPIVSAIVNFVTQGVSNMDKLPGAIWNIFIKVLTFVASWQVQLVQKGIQVATSFVNNVISGFSGLAGRISSALSGVANAIMKPFQDAWNYVKPYVDQIKGAMDAVGDLFSGFEGYSSFEGYAGVSDTLNGSIANYAHSSTNTASTINNNFYGLVEESAADYIVQAVNDRLKREKLLKGA